MAIITEGKRQEIAKEWRAWTKKTGSTNVQRFAREVYGCNRGQSHKIYRALIKTEAYIPGELSSDRTRWTDTFIKEVRDFLNEDPRRTSRDVAKKFGLSQPAVVQAHGVYDLGLPPATSDGPTRWTEWGDLGTLRKESSRGVSTSDLARMFNVTENTIRDIKRQYHVETLKPFPAEVRRAITFLKSQGINDLSTLSGA